MIDVVVLFFLFGLAAGLARSALKLPSALYDSLSLILLGVAQTFIAFAILRGLGRLGRADAASMAAHYGSVSVATFAVGVNWLLVRDIEFEPQMAVFLAIMEVPAILIGIVLARGVSRDTDWRALGHEAFLGKGVTLLLGGMAIGWIAGPDGLAPIKGVFFDLFKGALALFLLEMGLIVSRQVGELKRRGLFIVAFGLGMPLLSALLGLATGLALGLSPGGLTLLATLAASASYIAVPAAMRLAVPEANPALSLAAVLGVTFPFNILAGIPLYHALATQFTGATP